MATASSTAGSGDGRLLELSTEECFALLGETGVGRVAFVTASGPLIHPVNYLVDDQTIVLRTSPYTRLGGHPFGLVAFEVDDLDQDMRRGWSVVIVGRCAAVEDTDEAIALRRGGRLAAWAGGHRNLFVRITPQQTTGRRIV